MAALAERSPSPGVTSHLSCPLENSAPEKIELGKIQFTDLPFGDRLIKPTRFKHHTNLLLQMKESNKRTNCPWNP